MNKYTYKQFKKDVEEINSRKDVLFSYYKELVQKVNSLYQSNILGLGEMTELLNEISREQRDAIYRLNEEIHNLPQWD